MSVKRGGSWCSVYGCRNNSNVNKNISFFRYPRNVERSNAWIDATGRRDLLTKGTDYAYKNCRVCALHFLEDMFANELKNRLHSHAVPKILLSPAEIHAAAAAANPTINESNEDTSTSTQSTEFELTNPNTTVEQKPTSTNPDLTPLTPVTFFPPTSESESPPPVKKEDDMCNLENYYNRSAQTAIKTEYNDSNTYQLMDTLSNQPETIYLKMEHDDDDFDLIQSDHSSWDSYYKSLRTYYKLEEQHNMKLTKLHAVINSDDRNKRYTKCNICFKRLPLSNFKVHMKSHQEKKLIPV